MLGGIRVPDAERLFAKQQVNLSLAFRRQALK
jgi:hypothetical protein